MAWWLFKKNGGVGPTISVPRLEPRVALPVAEKRSSGMGYTSQVLSARYDFITGRQGLAELTSVVATAVALWEQVFAIADVKGDGGLLTRHTMAQIARALATRGESVWLIADDHLIAVSDWDLSTRFGRPTAYRLSLPEVGGGRSQTALAAECLHFRIGTDPSAPWTGTSPLRRARLSAELLQAVESAMGEAWATMPFASQVIPWPEASDVDLQAMGREFRGRRGSVLLRESANVAAAGGATPSTDWAPKDVTPSLERAAPVQTLAAARDAVALAYGILPAMLDRALTGPMAREAQRHAVQFTAQPILELCAEEASLKLGGKVEIDAMRPTQAFDSGASARSFATLVEGLSRAKEAGLDAATIAAAFARLDWQEN